MPAGFVIDNSVVMAWCFEDESSPYARAVQDALKTRHALVPRVWALEVANVLAVAERKKRITRSNAARFLVLLRSLPITVEAETPERVFGEISSLAMETGLTAYDASYLDLAIRQGLPLATLDADLRKAARKVGVAILRL